LLALAYAEEQVRAANPPLAYAKQASVALFYKI